MSEYRSASGKTKSYRYIYKETSRFSRIMCEAGKYAVLVIGCIIVILPIMLIILGSFKTHEDYTHSGVFDFPTNFSLENYATAFVGGSMGRGLLNTLIILVISCVGTIVTGTMTAYVVQRFTSKFTKLVKQLFLIAALLPNIAMQVTVFQIVHSIGLYNTIWAACALYIGTDIVSIYIFIQFLNHISYALDESALIDGASYPRIYFSIILPMLKPAIATVLVMKIIGMYNDFYTANLYMPDDKLNVVSTALYKFIGPYGAKWEIIFAGIVICIIPTLIIFLTLQKSIYSNITSGAVKG